MDRDEIKFIPLEGGSDTDETENEYMNNFMMTEPCGNPCHQDLNLLFPSSSSSSSGGDVSGEFKKLARILMTSARMNRRMISRAFDSLSKETDARFTRLEGDIENLKSIVSRCLETQGTHSDQNETAATVNTAPEVHSSNSAAEVDENDLLNTEQPVLQIILDDNDEGNNSGRNDIGRRQEHKGNQSSNNNMQNNEEEVSRRPGDNIQPFFLPENNNIGRVEKPRKPCKYCGRSYAPSYVNIHQRLKCPKGPQRRAQAQHHVPLPPSVDPARFQNPEAFLGEGNIFYVLNPSSDGRAEMYSASVV